MNTSNEIWPDELGRWQRRSRIVELLDATEKAGLNPLPLQHFHALAYFGNVLSPVWDLRPQDGKILKRMGGPYYPELQTDVDVLVGRGVVMPNDVSYFRDQKGIARLSVRYELNPELSAPIIKTLRALSDENDVSGFLRELAFAVGQLSKEAFEQALLQDATYSTPGVGYGEVIDFGEWRNNNASERVARRFDEFVPLIDPRVSAGEKLGLYVCYLDQVANA